MKKRINESSLKDQSYVNKIYNGLSDDEKKKWRKAIEECLAENPKFKSDINFFKFMSGYGGAVVTVGILISAPFLTVLGALPALATFFINRKTWKKIKNCARQKMNKPILPDEDDVDDSEPQTKVQESKKVVRLTESELVKLINKVLKEEKKNLVSEIINNPTSSIKLVKNTPEGNLLFVTNKNINYVYKLQAKKVFWIDVEVKDVGVKNGEYYIIASAVGQTKSGPISLENITTISQNLGSKEIEFEDREHNKRKLVLIK